MIEKHSGKLSKGCELCFEGKKSVLFITGKCPRNCLYCPLSEEKKNNDVIHINELKTREIRRIIFEIKESDSSGVGITGGDPLVVLDRTTKFIKKLKKKFGKGFHVHLYTSLFLVNSRTIKELQKAGLDEFRVHPDLNNKKEWEKIKLLKNKFDEVGIEIPAMPKSEKKIFELIEFSKDFINFYNLNELEYATLYGDYYNKNGWKVREDYSVKGSEEVAIKVIKKFPDLRIHYCSSKFKDSVQFTNRIRVRSENVAESFDKISEDGLLVRAKIETSKNNLKKLKKKLVKEFDSEFKIDLKKSRIIFDVDLAEDVAKKFKNVFVIEEYPTVDGLEAYLERLS